ncbi:MAG: hypothetical protein HC905_01260 [Bacteroidales bacterium]|nr:hypothetical protein [Bacteroidales bacterium]
MFKYIFFILSVLLLAGMLFTSKDAGISGDEEVHFKHSELVYQYFATLGRINRPWILRLHIFSIMGKLLIMLPPF